MDGQTTNVLALVTTALSNEIVLSWRALQRLRVLPKDFPRAQTTVKANQAKPTTKKAINARDASEACSVVVARSAILGAKGATKVKDIRNDISKGGERRLFKPNKAAESLGQPQAYADEKSKKNLDLRGCKQSRIAERIHRSKSKPKQFHPGAKVWIQDPKSKQWSIEAVIVGGISKRTFLVDDGTREFTRNRRFIRPAATPHHESAPRTGCMTNDQNTQERLNDQFAANQRRQRRSRRTKPRSKKRD